MIGSPFVNTELKIERVSDGKTLAWVIFDIEKIPEDELIWIIKTYKDIAKRAKCNEVVDEARTFMSEAEKIVNRGVAGGRVKSFTVPFIDPAMRAAPPLLVGLNASAEIGMWWCDDSNPSLAPRGALFTVNLCTSASLKPRRAIALNMWSTSSPGNLDTIIDSAGYHKSGTIGTSPFTFSRTTSQSSSSAIGTFVAASDATISSVVWLAASNTARDYSASCASNYPAPKGTCRADNYSSVYLPLWSWDVSVSVAQGEQYAVKIRFYV